MECPNCGNENANNALICPRCGYRYTGRAVAESARRVILTVLAIVAIMIVLVCIAKWNRG